MKRVFTFGFFPVHCLNYDLTGRTRTTTHHRIHQITAKILKRSVFLRREK
jgi:hypothetical protein